eukprot:318961-Chlamydomonas_euryale.AAC.1
MAVGDLRACVRARVRACVLACVLVQGTGGRGETNWQEWRAVVYCCSARAVQGHTRLLSLHSARPHPAMDADCACDAPLTMPRLRMQRAAARRPLRSCGEGGCC